MGKKKIFLTRLRLELRTLSVYSAMLLRTRDNQLHHPACADNNFGLVKVYIHQILSLILSATLNDRSRRKQEPKVDVSAANDPQEILSRITFYDLKKI